MDLARCWTETPVAVIDFETAGLSPSDGVVEVAVARFEQCTLVGRWSSMINPGRPIPEEATAVHGITDADVANAPALVSVSVDLARMCKDAVPCAYSADFDRGFLHYEITGTDCPAFDHEQRWIDPLVIVRKTDRYVPGSGRHKLEETCKRHGVELKGAHRAEADAIACGMLLYQLLDRRIVRPCPLGKLLDHIENCRREQERDYARYVASRVQG